MRPVHILGAGLLVGSIALGALLVAISYRWATVAYPPSQVPEVAQQPAGRPGAPVSPEVAAGQTLFGQKCSSCHTIGGGKLVGPDLKGVTDRRSHDFLVQFITAPDKLIASGDPTATQLVKDYGGVPMPNLGVTQPQAEQLLAYIQFQTSGAPPAATSGPGQPPAPTAAGAAATTPPQAAQPAASPGATTPGSAGVSPTPGSAGVSPAAGGTPAAPAPPAPPAALSPAATQGKATFDQKCASCHTIGGGKTVGPDLKGITNERPHDWLVQFISAPDKVIASGDPTATQLLKQYGTPMPNLGVSTDQADQILQYIAAQSGGGAAAPTPAPLPPGNASTGRALFDGGRPLTNGGPPCIDCHSAAGVGPLSGGTWGTDLTHAASKNGPAGLLAILKNPPFPGMKEAFTSRPITDSEAADLVAFFVESDTRAVSEPPGYTFPLIGVGGLVLFALLALVAWHNRTPQVRRDLVGR